MMKGFKWTDTLKTQNARFDSDHRMIIEKAHDLHDAMVEGHGKDRVIESLTFFNRSIRKHFAEEERLQVRKNYPHFQSHIQNHAYFIAELNKLTRQINEAPTSAANAAVLKELIALWLNHIKEMDVDLIKYLKNKKEG